MGDDMNCHEVEDKARKVFAWLFWFAIIIVGITLVILDSARTPASAWFVGFIWVAATLATSGVIIVLGMWATGEISICKEKDR